MDCLAWRILLVLEIVVAGGDGTVGWVLGCLGELNKQGRLPIPPTGVIPLGTGNDLSRSFGWGGSFPFNWKSSVKRTLEKVSHGPTARLDSWQVLISMPAGEELEIPYSLKATKETPLDQELEVEGELPEKVSCYQGVFYNYFSIGNQGWMPKLLMVSTIYAIKNLTSLRVPSPIRLYTLDSVASKGGSAHHAVVIQA